MLLFPLQSNFSWELIERIIGFYTVYQLFIYATLTQIDDTEKDSYNSLKVLYEETLIYFNMTNLDAKSKLSKHIHESIDMQKSDTAMNSNKIIEEYNNLISAISHNDISFVKIKILEYDHNLYHLDLNFRKSLFLRKFKDPSFDIKKRCLILSVSIFLLIIYCI